jgi:hypothetical protein
LEPRPRYFIDPAKEFRAIGSALVFAMENERIVAVGLLTQTNLRMLGSSLKTVFAVDDGTAEFDDLLRALDQMGEARG